MLLDAAHAEFLSRGYGGATLSSVAARAGVSTATLHKYFPTKRALFGGVMARFWATDAAPDHDLPSRAHEPAAALQAIGRAYAALLAPDETPALFRVVIAEAIQHPELGHELYERGKRPYLARLEQYVAAAAAHGLLDLRPAEVPLAVRQFLGMINDAIFWPRLLIPELRVSADEVDRVVDGAVRTFLARYARGHA